MVTTHAGWSNEALLIIARYSQRKTREQLLYEYEQIELVLARELAPGRDQPLSLINVDIDRFKEVNDALGHQAGDLDRPAA